MATTGSIVCTSGYGAVRYYATLPGTNDALVLIFLQATGQEDDDALRDHLTIATVLGATNRECTAANYVRKQITSGATITPDNTNNRVDVGLPSTTWSALGSMTGTNAQQAVNALLVAYQPDTTSGTDSTLLLLTKHYYPFIADGSDRIVPFPSGFYRAAG